MYLTAKDNFSYARYLFNPPTDIKRLYIITDIHLKVMRVYFWRLFVIETAKLVNQKEGVKYALRNFIKKLNYDRHYGDLKISCSKIKLWNNVLDDNKIIIILTDKVYARTEKSEETLKISLSFAQIEMLLSLAIDIIGEMYLAVFESSIVFETIDCARKEFNRGRF